MKPEHLENRTTVIISLILILLSLSVCTGLKDIHSLYDIHTVSCSVSQEPFLRMCSKNDTAVLLDGDEMNMKQYHSDDKDLEKMINNVNEEKWKHQISSDVFEDLMAVSGDGSHEFERRRGCEIERSSNGDVTLLKSGDEFRHNEEIIIYFNINNSQWEAVDKTFQSVTVKWNNSPRLNQINKDYLLRGCMNRLHSHPDDQYEIVMCGTIPETDYGLLMVCSPAVIFFLVIIYLLARKKFSGQNIFLHLKQLCATAAKLSHKEESRFRPNDEELERDDVDQTKKRLTDSVDIPPLSLDDTGNSKEILM